MKLALLLSIFLFKSGHAIELCKTLPQQVPVGTKCMTSSNFEFERTQNGWKDLGINGKIWYDHQKVAVDQGQAETFCDAFGLNLPSGYTAKYKGQFGFPNQSSDFGLAEARGFREVLKDFRQEYYWSSSVMPYEPWNHYFTFSGKTGNIFSGEYRGSNFLVARCVSQ